MLDHTNEGKDTLIYTIVPLITTVDGLSILGGDEISTNYQQLLQEDFRTWYIWEYSGELWKP